MLKDSDIKTLRHNPQIARYFRYPLHTSDFPQVREKGQLLGRMAAKPLHERLAPDGKVDTTSRYSGEIAIIFIPARARSLKSVKLLFTQMSPDRITTHNGKRNWPEIWAAAEDAVKRMLLGPIEPDKKALS